MLIVVVALIVRLALAVAVAATLVGLVSLARGEA